CLSLALGVPLFVGYFAVADGAVALCFGPGLEVARPVVLAVALNQFLSYMRGVPRRRSTNKERPLILSTNIGRLDMHVMVFYRGFRHAEPRPVVLQAFVANHVDLV
ncbi:MAG: hypothetical protein UHS51_03730, partial [Atopobiaceae bacterium]|nr:hypothetical protein [Atopobiaceae bacterium]